MPFRLNGDVYQGGASIPRGTFVSDELAAKLSAEGHEHKLVRQHHDEATCPPDCGPDCPTKKPGVKAAEPAQTPPPSGVSVSAGGVK